MTDVLKHCARPWPPRPAAFAKPVGAGTGIIFENGESVVADGWGIDVILDECAAGGARVCYVVGDPGVDFFVPRSGGGWQLFEFFRSPLVARYRRAGDGDREERVDVYSSATFFGGEQRAWACRRAYVWLRRALREKFRGAEILGTPARTGIDLIERSLPRNRAGEPYGYGPLPTGALEYAEAVGQGRLEFFPDNAEEAARTVRPGKRRLYVYDMRWAYAACCRHVPCLPAWHWRPQRESEKIPFLSGIRPGFYRVRYQVPVFWGRRPGLLPERADDGHWQWPREPDTWHEAIVGDAELKLAVKIGWYIEVIDGWIFSAQDEPHADPLRDWIEKLREIRERFDQRAEAGDEIAALCSKAIRMVVIAGIGALHRKSRPRQRLVPLEQAGDLDAETVRDIGSKFVVVEEPSGLHEASRRYYQPHWAAAVWSRARARLAETVMSINPAKIICLRHDSIVSWWRLPLRDNGNIGSFRLKRSIMVPDYPCCESDYRMLLAGAEAEAEAGEDE